MLQEIKYKLKIMDTEQIFDGNKIYNINADDMEVTLQNLTEAAPCSPYQLSYYLQKRL
jgi:hypothetical protein